MKEKLIMSLSKLFLFIFIFSSVGLFAQNGNIAGRVTDSQSGEFLPSANVLLVGTRIGSATDLQGAYRISNVPPGNYKLQVRYIGYADFVTDVTVVSGRTVEVVVKLTPSYVNLEDVVVEGLRQGQVKALSVQREAENIKNVVSREQMESFPDANVAEVVQRIPGVYIGRSLGDGRYALIRGTEPRLSAITVNGEVLASTRNQERFSQLDIVGSNQMSFIEVNKAITPEMDANAIGGSVNVITKSAFDYPGMNLKVVVASGYVDNSAKPSYHGNFTFSTRFGENKNFGITLTANYDSRERGTDNMEFTWDEKQDANKNVIPFALAEVNFMDYVNKKDRYGLGGGVEYRFNDFHRIYANILWNQFDDWQDRGRMRLRVDSGNYLNATGTLTQNSRIALEQRARLEQLFQNQYSFGGVHQLGNLNLNYHIAHTYGEENHYGDIITSYDFYQRVNLALDFADKDFPKYTITNTNIPVDARLDPTKYDLNAFDYRDMLSTTKYTVGRLNFELPYNFFEYPSKLKAGFKYTTTFKDRDDDRWSYSYLKSPKLNLAYFLGDRNRTDFMEGNYVFGPQTDYKKVEDFVNANRTDATVLRETLNWYDSEGATYESNEDILAYFLMTDINFGKASLLAGFRHEFTSTDYTGNLLVFDAAGNFSSLTPTNEKRDYNNLFPMVHFRYDLFEMTKIRASITQSIARPNFFDLAPTFFLEPRNKRYRSGNPDLKPTESTNLDLMVEHYFSGIGQASASLFYKSLKGIIFESRKITTTGAYIGYEERMPVNGGDAELYGMEFNWQQELTFLPGFLSGFGIYFNYTHTWAEADLQGRKGFLPGQSGDVGNIALAYEKDNFKARLAYAFQGKFLRLVGKNTLFDVFVDSHGQLDFSASYNFWQNLEAFVEVNNITNAPERQYLGVEWRPYLQEFYSWWSRAGIKWSL